MLLLVFVWWWFASGFALGWLWWVVVLLIVLVRSYTSSFVCLCFDLICSFAFGLVILWVRWFRVTCVLIVLLLIWFRFGFA